MGKNKFVINLMLRFNLIIYDRCDRLYKHVYVPDLMEKGATILSPIFDLLYISSSFICILNILFQMI